jgi:hypothetical protein
LSLLAGVAAAQSAALVFVVAVLAAHRLFPVAQFQRFLPRAELAELAVRGRVQVAQVLVVLQTSQAALLGIVAAGQRATLAMVGMACKQVQAAGQTVLVVAAVAAAWAATSAVTVVV